MIVLKAATSMVCILENHIHTPEQQYITTLSNIILLYNKKGLFNLKFNTYSGVERLLPQCTVVILHFIA